MAANIQNFVNSPHYIVVGAGVMGCNLAYELSKTANVTLLEQSNVGAFSVPVALLNPFRGRSARASSLDIAGLETMQTLAYELSALGIDHGIHTTGIIRIASNAQQAKQWRKLKGIQWLERQNFPDVYHAPFGGFLVNSGGFVDSYKFLNALVSAARDNGLELVENCHVLDIDLKEATYYLKTNKGVFEADGVFLCVGSATHFLHLLPKMTYNVGEVAVLESTFKMSYPLAGAVYASLLGKRFYVGGNHRSLGEEDLTATKQLQSSISWFIPRLRDARYLSTWTGTRAKTEDNLPIVKELGPKFWFLGALAGRGFLCAAYLARKFSQTIKY